MMPQNDIVKAILDYSNLGFAVFPTRNKVPHGPWKESLIDLFPDPKRYPDGEFGVVLKSTDLVVDIDPRNFPQGRRIWTEFCSDFDLPEYIQRTRIVHTASGGMHVYLTKPAGFKIRKGHEDYPGLDFLSEGAYCIGAGSVIGGRPYRLIADNTILEAPANLLNAIHKTVDEFNLEGTKGFRDTEENKQQYEEYLKQAPPAIQGQNGDHITYVTACRGRDQNLSPEVTLDLMWRYFNPRCQPQWEHHDLHNKVRNAYSYAKHPAGVRDPAAVFPDMSDKALPDKKWMLKLDCTKADTYKSTLKNCVLFIEHDNQLKGKFRFNEFNAKIELADKLPWEDQRLNPLRAINDLEVGHIALYLAETYNVEFPTKKVWEALHIVANKKTYHPIRDELNTYRWDGIKRIDTWLSNYCGAADAHYTRMVGRKTLIAACARIFEPGCKFDYVLVLEGEQGVGKSTVCRILGGKWYGDSTFDINNKDTVEYVHDHWIIEFAEMANTRKADINNMKNFISRCTDDTRLPYARSRVCFPRQCIFIGTVNPDAIGYLTDETGNRRYWPVFCREFKLDMLKQDRNQLLAEALDAYKKGEDLYLPKDLEEDARLIVKERVVKDPWRDVIFRWLDNNFGGLQPQEVTSEMIYTMAIGGTVQTFDTSKARRIVNSLRAYGLVPLRKASGNVYIRRLEASGLTPTGVSRVLPSQSIK